MKLRTAVVAIAAIVISGHAAAQTCPSNTSRVQNVGSLVGNNTMCAVRGTDRWQEFHQSGGALIDWKLGSNLASVDPTKQVGTWTSSNGSSSTVTHTYTGGPSYTWAICQVTDNNYTLVSANDSVSGVSIRTGQVACTP